MRAILFDGNSPLFPVTRQKVDTLRETLKRDKLTPWIWFNSDGVKVTDFYGKTIAISGVVFTGTVVLVFWQSIVPFLKDGIVKTLNETLETCLARGWEPEPYIRETAMLLAGHLIDPIYHHMGDIDRRIRGRGNPKSVKRKDVTDYIAHMETFLDGCKDEMIQGLKAESRRSVETPTTHAKADTNEQPSGGEGPLLAPVDDLAMLSPAQLAERFGIPEKTQALKKRLERLRKTNQNCFTEIADRGPKDPQFLYRVRDVRPVIEALKASREASRKRPT
jgi:hypothetical protein